MKLFTHLFFTFFLTAVFWQTSAQQISKTLVGTNYWYKDISPKIWNLTRNTGVKVIRIGGADYDKNMPSNEILSDWVRKIQAIGAQPILQVSQYKSAKKAAETVKYFNKDGHKGIKPIKYWNIGNEPWLQANRPDLTTFGAKVEAYFKPIAAAMKSVDPSIKIYGPDFCDFLDQPIADLFGGKNDITVKVPGKKYYYCDGLAWHRYPQSDADAARYGSKDILVRVLKSKNLIEKVNKQNNRYGKSALHWAIGEFNSKGGPEVHTFGNGQMFAAVFAYGMEYGATYAAGWSMFENGGNRKGTDFSMYDGKNLTPRSSARHMELIAKYFKGKFIKGSSPDSNFLVFGAKEKNQLSIMIMNTGYGPARDYALNFRETGGKAGVLNFTMDTRLNKAYQDKINQRTTQVLIFKGNKITRIVYGSEDFDSEREPVVTQIN